MDEEKDRIIEKLWQEFVEAQRAARQAEANKLAAEIEQTRDEARGKRS